MEHIYKKKIKKTYNFHEEDVFLKISFGFLTGGLSSSLREDSRPVVFFIMREGEEEDEKGEE